MTERKYSDEEIKALTDIRLGSRIPAPKKPETLLPSPRVLEEDSYGKPIRWEE